MAKVINEFVNRIDKGVELTHVEHDLNHELSLCGMGAMKVAFSIDALNGDEAFIPLFDVDGITFNEGSNVLDIEYNLVKSGITVFSNKDLIIFSAGGLQISDEHLSENYNKISLIMSTEGNDGDYELFIKYTSFYNLPVDVAELIYNTVG